MLLGRWSTVTGAAMALSSVLAAGGGGCCGRAPPGLCCGCSRCPCQAGRGCDAAAGWRGSGELNLVGSAWDAPGLVVPLARGREGKPPRSSRLQSHLKWNHRRSWVHKNWSEGLKAPSTETAVVNGSVLHRDTSLTPNAGGGKMLNNTTWETNGDTRALLTLSGCARVCVSRKSPRCLPAPSPLAVPHSRACCQQPVCNARSWGRW